MLILSDKLDGTSASLGNRGIVLQGERPHQVTVKGMTKTQPFLSTEVRFLVHFSGTLKSYMGSLYINSYLKGKVGRH